MSSTFLQRSQTLTTGPPTIFLSALSTIRGFAALVRQALSDRLFANANSVVLFSQRLALDPLLYYTQSARKHFENSTACIYMTRLSGSNALHMKHREHAPCC